MRLSRASLLPGGRGASSGVAAMCSVTTSLMRLSIRSLVGEAARRACIVSSVTSSFTHAVRQYICCQQYALGGTSAMSGGARLADDQGSCMLRPGTSPATSALTASKSEGPGEGVGEPREGSASLRASRSSARCVVRTCAARQAELAEHTWAALQWARLAHCEPLAALHQQAESRSPAARLAVSSAAHA